MSDGLYRYKDKLYYINKDLSPYTFQILPTGESRNTAYGGSYQMSDMRFYDKDKNLYQCWYNGLIDNSYYTLKCFLHNPVKDETHKMEIRCLNSMYSNSYGVYNLPIYTSTTEYKAPTKNQYGFLSSYVSTWNNKDKCGLVFKTTAPISEITWGHGYGRRIGYFRLFINNNEVAYFKQAGLSKIDLSKYR